MGAVSGRFALYATDTQGAMRAVELERHLDQVDLFVRADVRAALPDFVCSFQHSVQDVLNTHLDHYECHIVFLRPGQSGWQLAGVFPLNGNLHRVLVIAVDTSAGICLPVYGEHEAGRLHQLTEQVAWLLGLQPVLSFPGSQDEARQCLLSLGLRHGWTLEPASNAALQRVATALFQKRPVAWVQSSGARPVWPLGLAGAGGVVQHCSLDTLNPDAYEALVLVSDQCGISEKLALHSDKTLIWRPKSLVVGVYCHRDTPLEVVGQGLVQFLDDNGLSIDSVRYMAGLDLQRHHPALNDFGIIHNIPLLTYRIEELLGADPERPVALMKRLWESGRFSVADAAARHCSGATTALVPESNFCLQTDGPSVSMVICRIPESHVATSLPEPRPTGRHRPEHGGRHQIVVCSGVHCSRAGSCHRLADYVRRLARDLPLDQGARQIQVASSVCCVACRYKNSAVIHERLSAHEIPVNDGVRLRGVHSFSRTQWQQILRAVNRRQPLRSLVAPSHLVPMGNE